MTVYKVYLLVIPRRSLDYFRLLYERLYETICCTRYTTFELSGREDSFVFGRLYQSLIFLRFAFCGLLFDVSANALSSFFVLIISHTLLLYFLQQFGNKVGQGRFRGKAVPTYVYPECIKAAIRALVSEDLRDFPNPETPAVRLV